MNYLRIFGLGFVLCLAPSIVRADLAPPKPKIARNPVLANERQPAFGRTIAAAVMLTAVISAAGIALGRMRPAGRFALAIGVATVIVWAGAVWFIRNERLMATREQEQLSVQAEREWAEWEQERIRRRQNWVGEEPASENVATE